jgi:MFS family permease
MTTPEERPLYISAVVGAETLSLALGAILGGVITEKASYKWCFLLNVPSGLISCGLVVFFFREPMKMRSLLTWRERVRRLDLVGSILLITAILFLTLGLQFVSQSNDWTDAKTIVFLVLSGVTMAAFVAQQWYGDRSNSFLPPDILNREVCLALSMGFLAVFANFISSTFLGVYFQVGSTLRPKYKGGIKH